jgi:hypothetical protein
MCSLSRYLMEIPIPPELDDLLGRAITTLTHQEILERIRAGVYNDWSPRRCYGCK